MPKKQTNKKAQKAKITQSSAKTEASEINAIVSVSQIAIVEQKQPAQPNKKTKKQIVIELLEAGVTITQLMDATGWQKHTVFGTIANLKKKLNLNISCEDKIYRIIKA
jgi:Protein of unknown function (DUF3489)